MAVQMLQGSCRADYGVFVISGRGSHTLTESLRSGCFISELQGFLVGTRRQRDRESECSRRLCINAGYSASILQEPWSGHGFSYPSHIIRPRRSPQNFANGFCCNNSFSELGSATTFVEWTPAVDNLLLVLSIALAYVAGIITPSTANNVPPASSKGSTASAKLEEFKQKSEVRDKTNETQSWKHDMWDGVRLKILKGMDVVDNMQDEVPSKGVQLSIQALAKGPRLHMLLITLEQLKKEVGNLQEIGGYAVSDWSDKSTQMLCDSVISIFQRWVCEEHVWTKSCSPTTEDTFSRSLGSTSPVPGELLPRPMEVMVDDEDRWQWSSLLDSEVENYAGKGLMMKNLKETGKAEFYADFLHFLCFGGVREKSFCSVQTLRRCKALILEDLVIYVADRASALFLDLVSAGNSVFDDQWLNVIAHPISSTRMLEKLRNEVALNGWINENFHSVTAMFEDRFDLWIFKDDAMGLRSLIGKKRSSKRNSNSKAIETECPDLVIEEFKLSARRGRELRALSGWRYYYSLYLEFSDICGPLLRTVVMKVSEGISFLLVTLIGRSLGLIYRGICQSVQWTSK